MSLASIPGIRGKDELEADARRECEAIGIGAAGEETLTRRALRAPA